jgi:radical SAM protein with 4Fe4S-binding SPASM domain
MVSYSITTKCNLKCKHCYSDSIDQASPDELTTEEACRLMDDLSGWGIGLLIIDGGEPLCCDDMLNIVRYASSKRIRCTIGSNGTLIDRATAQKMLDAGVMAIAISLDAADAPTHDSFRGVAGAFEQTLRGIEACRNASLPFQLNMVIRKETLPKLEDMLRRVPYYGRGCAAGMPMGYMMVKSNGEVNPCMLLQVNLGNVRNESIVSIWENSPMLAELRDRDLLKGRCSDCQYKLACSGCRGRAYEETGDMMAADSGCWLAHEVATANEEGEKKYGRTR